MSKGRHQSGERSPTVVPSDDMIVVGDHDPAVLEAARQALNGYLRDGRWYDSRPYAAARFTTRLDAVNDGWRDTRYEFRLIPRGAVTGDLTPRGAEPCPIADEPSLAYRGMSWEEWQAALASGVIASLGEHNFANQTGLTMFASQASIAESYAGGFAPWMHQPAYGLPGVIVAVPRAGALDHEMHPGVPSGSGELAFDHPVPVADIRDVWFLVPTSVREGKLEVVIDKFSDRPPSEGSRMSPSVRYAIVEATGGRFGRHA